VAKALAEHKDDLAATRAEIAELKALLLASGVRPSGPDAPA